MNIFKLARLLLGKKEIDAFKELSLKLADILDIINKNFKGKDQRVYALVSCAYTLLFFPAEEALKDEADWQRYMDDVIRTLRKLAGESAAIIRKPKGVV